MFIYVRYQNIDEKQESWLFSLKKTTFQVKNQLKLMKNQIY